MTEPGITLGLIGWPLGHSLSPILHQAALKDKKIAGSYQLFPLEPDIVHDRLAALLAEMHQGKITGLNVTIPYKQTVIQYMDRLSDSAKIVGAVNTIYIRDGEFIGENTDIEGFVLDLKTACADHQLSLEKPGSALILGAGGSASAVAYGLCMMGWNVIVAARRKPQAESLAKQMSQIGTIGAVAWPSEDEQILKGVSLIVNTTPVGMAPKEEASPWPNEMPFPSSGLLYDLIYNPVETRLMGQAKRAGLAAVSGMGMLVNQAALSFSMWLDVPPPVRVMRGAIEDYIKIIGAEQ